MNLNVSWRQKMITGWQSNLKKLRTGISDNTLMKTRITAALYMKTRITAVLYMKTRITAALYMKTNTHFFLSYLAQFF